MYGFIFGFQRLVWWPKWTPASIMSRMVSGVSRDGISDEGADEVSVSMFSFRVVSSADVIGFHHRGAGTDGTRGPLDQRVVFKRGQVSTTISPPNTENIRFLWPSPAAPHLLKGPRPRAQEGEGNNATRQIRTAHRHQ